MAPGIPGAFPKPLQKFKELSAGLPAWIRVEISGKTGYPYKGDRRVSELITHLSHNG